MADDVTTQSATLATVPASTVIATRDIDSAHHQVMAPYGGSLTDGSGDIVAGSTSEEVFAANTSRVYLLVQNVSDTNMWVNFGIAAVADQPSVFLAANGGSIVFADSFVPTGTVNIICATSGKAYVAKQA